MSTNNLTADSSEIATSVKADGVVQDDALQDKDTPAHDAVDSKENGAKDEGDTTDQVELPKVQESESELDKKNFGRDILDTLPEPKIASVNDPNNDIAKDDKDKHNQDSKRIEKEGKEEKANNNEDPKNDADDTPAVLETKIDEHKEDDTQVEEIAKDLNNTRVSDTAEHAVPRHSTSPPPISRPMSNKVPADTHPLQNATADNTGNPSPARVAASILSRENQGHQSSYRMTRTSTETDRTAFSPSSKGTGSPVSQAIASGSHVSPEIAIANDDDLDAEEAYEERQRQLYRIAEQRRKQREQMMQDKLSSVDVKILRSGLADTREQVRPLELRIISGKYPSGLRGTMYTLGPGRFDVKYSVQGELEQSTHMFMFGHIMDALPLISKFSFDPKSDSITYRSRHTAKQLASRIQMEHGINPRYPGSLYHTDTNQTFLNMFMPRAGYFSTPEGECCGQDLQLFMPVGSTPNSIVCTNHVGALQQLDADDLLPKMVVEWKDINKLFKGTLSCPHIQSDSRTGEYFSVVQNVGFRTTTYSVIAVSEAQPQGYVIASFVAQASVLHSFTVTHDYIIVPVYPYSSPIGGANYRWGDSLLGSLTFIHGQPVHFYVISREYRRVQCVYQAPSFFALHQINAFQSNSADTITIDLVAYEDDTVLKSLDVKSLRNPSTGFFIPSGQVRRYELQGITMEASKYIESKGRSSIVPTAHMLIMRPEPIELPQINTLYSDKPYNNVYGLTYIERLQGLGANMNTNTMYNAIIKLDVNDAMMSPIVWRRHGCYPSEPVFVPRNDKEDDGYLVSVFFDSTVIKSFLLILDAKTLEEVAIAELPFPIPLSFGHAKFVI